MSKSQKTLIWSLVIFLTQCSFYLLKVLTDAFSKVAYDPVEHLNANFQHPSTLSSVADVSEAIRSRRIKLDEDIAEAVRNQAGSDVASVRQIQSAKAELTEMFQKTESVRDRAIHTEQ